MKIAFTKWLAATLPLLYVINSSAKELPAVSSFQATDSLTTRMKTDSLSVRHDTDSTAKVKWLSGSFYTEANYGYNFFGKNRDIYDFPHAVLDLDIRLGRGWSFSTEQEFEYLNDDGEWPTHFSQMYCCNWAYFEKEFSPKLRVRAGVLNVPVGLTSAYYGTGLTVYDPPSEDRVLPMKWHETGLAVTGELGKLEYYVALMRHVAWLDTNPQTTRCASASPASQARVLRLKTTSAVAIRGATTRPSISTMTTRAGCRVAAWCTSLPTAILPSARSLASASRRGSSRSHVSTW